MKKLFCLILISISAHLAHAQSMYGILAGAGFATTVNSQATPSYRGEYLVSPFRHIYMGGDLFIENYAFTHNDNLQAEFGGPGYVITQSSTYVFVTPKIDLSIGPNEYFHVFISGGFGWITSGEQTNEINPAESYNKSIYTGQFNFTGNTSQNITPTIFRFSIGTAQHIRIFPDWYVSLSEEFCIIPSYLSKNTYGYSGDKSMDIKTNYLAFAVGIIHKHHWERLKPLRTWGGY